MDVLLTLFNNFFGYFSQIVASLERGKFYEHREVHPGNDLNLIIFQKAETQIRRGSSEHISENHDAIFLVHPLQALVDLLFRCLDIIVPADGNGFNIAYVSKYDCQRIQKLFRKFSVGNDNSADQLSSSSMATTSV